MPTPFDFVLAAVIAIGLPVRAFFGDRRLTAASAAELPALRPKLYARAIVSQWTLVAGVAALWLWRRRGLDALALVPERSWALGGILVGLAFIVPILLRQRSQIANDAELRERVRERLAGAIRLMPAHDGEHGLFNALALTAGICEELLYRGYLVWLASHFTPIVVAHALVAVAFGVGHAYQGRSGMFRTGFAGAFFSGVVLVTGMLYPAMVIHAGMDLLAGDLGRRVGEDAPAPADGA